MELSKAQEAVLQLVGKKGSIYFSEALDVGAKKTTLSFLVKNGLLEKYTNFGCLRWRLTDIGKKFLYYLP